VFSVPRIATFLTAIVVLASPIIARQQPNQTKEPSGTISGRVTVDDRPARGVIVLLLPGDLGLSNKPTSKATTDSDGRFQLRGIPAGGYQLQAFAPALVSSNTYGRPSQIINLNDGESVDGIDVALKPGGVITGRVTDTDGQPVIQENIRLISADQSKRQIYLPYTYMMSSTDDRGIYRLFGVPPGRYLVAVGGNEDSPASAINGRNTYYHPVETTF
jgi:Carboxypeptidase regulatory-like domain